MKNIVKLGLILFISLLIPISSFSQDTYQTTKDSLIVITPKQLKITNLIFAEHSELKKEQPLLKLQIEGLEKIIDNYTIQDSIRTAEIATYEEKVASDQKKIKKVKNRLNLSSGLNLGLFMGLILAIFL